MNDSIVSYEPTDEMRMEVEQDLRLGFVRSRMQTFRNRPRTEPLVTRVFHEDEEIFAFEDGLPLPEVETLIGADFSKCAIEISSISRKAPLTEEERRTRLCRATLHFLMRKVCDEFFAPMHRDRKTMSSGLEMTLQQEIFGDRGGVKDPGSWVTPKPWLRKRKGSR